MLSKAQLIILRTNLSNQHLQIVKWKNVFNIVMMKNKQFLECLKLELIKLGMEQLCICHKK